MTAFNNIIWIGCDSLGQANPETAARTVGACQTKINRRVREEGDVLLVPRRVTFLVTDEVDARTSGEAGKAAA